jgi:hypothetical protein
MNSLKISTPLLTGSCPTLSFLGKVERVNILWPFYIFFPIPDCWIELGVRGGVGGGVFSKQKKSKARLQKTCTVFK